MKKTTKFKFISPSSSATFNHLTNCRAFAEAYQYEADFTVYSSEQFYDLAGSDSQRIEDFNEAFFAESAAIFAIRGGYGSARLLEGLDFKALASVKKPTPFFGYSDTTALQLALWKHCHIKSYSGLLPGIDFSKKLNPLTAHYFTAILKNKTLPPVTNLSIYQKGKASGILLGGCLSVLNSLLGTSHCPDFTGAILFLEEVNEPTYVIDRLLNQLKSAGILQNLAGLIFGAFTKCEPRNNQEFPLNLVLKHYAQFVGGPVCYNLPYGHISKKIIIPIGGKALLDGSTGVLTFLEERY